MARTEETRRHRDPDFDRTNPRAPMPTEDLVGYYQRLLVNPFLGGFAFALTVYLSWLLAELGLPLLIVPVVVLGAVASYVLLRFHCLDCGTTGPFRRWRSHACAAVWERWNDRLSFWRRLYPDPTAQLKLWLVAIVLAGFLVAVVRGPRG